MYFFIVVDDVNVDFYVGLNVVLDVLVCWGEVFFTVSVFGVDVEKFEVFWGTMYKRWCGYFDDIECLLLNVVYCFGLDEFVMFEGVLCVVECVYKVFFGDD